MLDPLWTLTSVWTLSGLHLGLALQPRGAKCHTIQRSPFACRPTWPRRQDAATCLLDIGKPAAIAPL